MSESSESPPVTVARRPSGAKGWARVEICGWSRRCFASQSLRRSSDWSSRCAERSRGVLASGPGGALAGANRRCGETSRPSDQGSRAAVERLDGPRSGRPGREARRRRRRCPQAHSRRRRLGPPRLAADRADRTSSQSRQGLRVGFSQGFGTRPHARAGPPRTDLHLRYATPAQRSQGAVQGAFRVDRVDVRQRVSLVPAPQLPLGAGRSRPDALRIPRSRPQRSPVAVGAG